MDKNKTLLIGLIAIVLIILAGIFIYSQGMGADNDKANSNIQLKTQDFKAFEIDTPVGSDFSLKNNQTEVGKGMLYYKNSGDYAKEIEGIIINKNLTDSLISDNMNLVASNSSDVKIYSSLSRNGTFYELVKTVNDTDIILTGHDLNLLQKMANTSNVKDTSALTVKEVKTPKNVTTQVNKTVNKTQNQVNKTVEKTQNQVNKTVAKTQESKTPVEKVVEKTNEQKTQAPKSPNKISQNNPNPESVITDNPTKTTYPLYIGGGSFTTGSGLDDKTFAKIYLGAEHAGEEIGIKIFYSRDGNSLNQGNYVTTPVESTGYVNIASADSYSLYPDYATVNVYDCYGNLQDTQGISLEPTSGTQYF